MLGQDSRVHLGHLQTTGTVALSLGSPSEHGHRQLYTSLITETALTLLPTDTNIYPLTIKAAVSGSGHFIDAPETMVSMERDYYYPKLASREEPIV